MTRSTLATFAILLVIPLLTPGTASADVSSPDHPASTTAGGYLCKYKPNYFILGVAENNDERPTTKFQFSFRYVLWGKHLKKEELEDQTGHQESRCGHPNSRHQVIFGYTQKSIWKLYDESAPFDENNYNPEIYYSWDTSKALGWGGLDWVTLGLEHESNGLGGGDSRSWNRAYLQARFEWTDLFDAKKAQAAKAALVAEKVEEKEATSVAAGQIGWDARFYAKAWAILQSNDETDYARNIGHFKLIAELKGPDYCWGSVAFDIEGSVGDDFNRGSLSLGASYGVPFRGTWRFIPTLYAQYFEGYGETLLRADTLTRAFRIGFRFLR